MLKKTLAVLSTIRVKIIVGVAIILLLVITGMTFILLDLTRPDLISQVRLRGEGAIDSLFRALDGPAESELPALEELRRELSRLVRSGGALRVDELSFFDSELGLLAELPSGASSPAEEREVLRRVLQRGRGLERLSESRLVLFRAYRRDGETWGVVRAGLSLEPVQEALDRYRQNVFQVIAVESGLILLLISLLLTVLVAKPIEQLVGVAERIAAGDLDYRVEVLHQGEIGRLAASFNRMLGRLQKAREARERHIRDLEKAYAALQRAQAQLVASEKMASVGRLAAGMAHEIGNPLSSIHGYTEILLLDETSEERRGYLERVQLEVERITRIIQELLDYSRPGRSSRDGPPEPVLLSAAAERALYLVKTHPTFRKDDVQLRSELPAESLWVVADEHQLSQVVINLLLNARHAVRGAGTVEVRCGRCRDGWPPEEERGWPERPAEMEEPVYLAVLDDGPGIAAVDRDKLFEPFFTTKEPGQGTGLGLFVVHTLLQTMGGTIRVSTQPGEGSNFVVFLPEAASREQ